jgi:ABC-type multidrug transport system permease subunit
MFEDPGQNENRMPLTFFCKNVCNMQLTQGLAVIFSHRQVYAARNIRLVNKITSMNEQSKLI